MGRQFPSMLVCIGVLFLFPAILTASGAEVITTEKMKIKIGYAPFGMMQTTVAKAKSFHRKYLPNVAIEWVFGVYSIHLINKWVEGELEIAYLGDMPAILLQNRLRNTKWVSVGVYPHGKVAAIYVPHDSPISSIQELDGATIATGIGSSHHRILDLFAAAEGIQFKLLNRSPDEGLVDLKEGKVDAVCYWPPYLEIIKYHDFGRTLVADFVRYEPQVNAIWPLVVSEDFARKHPEIVAGLVRADQDLHAFMEHSPDEAAQIVYEELAERVSLPVVKASLANYRYTDELGKEQIDTMQLGIDFLHAEGVIRERFSAADWADSSFSQ